jgi:hypothetical protein
MKFDGNLTLSGSITDEAPVAAMLFEKDGSMNLVIIDSSSEDESNSIRLVSGFFQYALSRDDWMAQYASIVIPDPKEKVNKHKRSHLRLVKSDKNDIN